MSHISNRRVGRRFRLLNLGLLAGLAVGLVAAPACERKQSTPETKPLAAKRQPGTMTPAPPPKSQARFALPRRYPPADNALTGYKPPVMTDATIRNTVRRKLFADPAVRGTNVEVAVTRGVVTLGGQVSDLRAKRRAVRVAEATRGVRSVVDEIGLAPVKRTDLEVLRDVRVALAQDASTRPLAIRVTVQKGEVTLTGTVATHAARELVAGAVRNVRGVLTIHDKLTLSPQSQKTTAKLKEQVERRLRADDRLDAHRIHVQVKDQVVFLRGTVPSAAEKRWAVRRAHIPGVLTVDARQLGVRYRRPNRAQTTSPPSPPTDDQVRSEVRDALYYDPRVTRTQVKVTALDGVVSLFGRVDHLKAIRAADKDARHAWGVVDVHNYLTVKPKPGMSDGELAQRAQGFLDRDPVLWQEQLKVRVTGGVARLSGTVPAAYDRALAEDLVSRVEGIQGIRNRIEILSRRSHTPDVTLRRAIRNALYWSPYVKEKRVQVRVREGVAHLSGRVPSYHAYLEASAAARRAGAWRVRNQLQIDPALR